jgi:hypothetical protein
MARGYGGNDYGADGCTFRELSGWLESIWNVVSLDCDRSSEYAGNDDDGNTVMATWISSPIVAGVSGELGGVVFHSGARSNVLARRPSRCRVATREQDEWQRALIAALKQWDELLEEQRVAWRQYAKARVAGDRFGRMRQRSGQATFVEYLLRVDPFRSGGIFTSLNAPTVTRDPYTTVTVGFTGGGPFNVTVAPWAAGAVSECIEVARFRQYGPRPATGSKRRMLFCIRNAATMDWHTQFAARGMDLSSGEQFRLEVWWEFGFCWPSRSVFVDGTVT